MIVLVIKKRNRQKIGQKGNELVNLRQQMAKGLILNPIPLLYTDRKMSILF